MHYLSKNLTPKLHNRLLYVFGGLFLLFFGWMKILDIPLKESVPGGIVDFELARTLPRSQEMLTAWNDILPAVYRSLQIDYFFLIVYAVFFALVIYKIALRYAQKKNWVFKLGVFLAGLQFIAAAFDVIENYCLFQLAGQNFQSKFSTIAFYSASVKFGIIGLGVVYMVLAGLILLVRKDKSFA